MNVYCSGMVQAMEVSIRFAQSETAHLCGFAHTLRPGECLEMTMNWLMKFGIRGDCSDMLR